MNQDQRGVMKRQFDGALRRFQSLAALDRESVHPALEKAVRNRRSPLDETVFGLHLRALAWAHTIKRLDDVFDFQGQSAGCRSLFEIVIDLVLLTRGVEPVERLTEWEVLSKFRSAEKSVRQTGGDASVKRAASRFIEANRASVEASRTRFWPTQKKPMRWTGKPLFDDALRADKAVPLKLEELSREHYERLCWGTHGSGLVLVRGISEELFPGYAILAVHLSFGLLEHVIQLALEHFNLNDIAWVESIQRAHDAERMADNNAILEAMAKAAEASRHEKGRPQ